MVEYRVIEEIKRIFAGDASGHDYWHTMRVYQNAVSIAETMECDKTIVALGALLHDVDDAKLFDTSDHQNARNIMRRLGVSEDVAEQVIRVIETVSFSKNRGAKPETVEGRIVQDADRLDAIGAIGIARAFAYGGSTGRSLHNPESPADDTAAHQNTTIAHFYEKLFQLKDLMHTDAAKQMAEHRHWVMEQYINEFLEEWDGKR